MGAFPLSIEEYEQLNPVAVVNHEGQQIRFCTPSRITASRVRTLFQRERDTLAWITEFAPDAVMIDVGANVGTYTIWAAMTQGTQVFSFEPEAQNYALLIRNILYNELGERVRAFCVGLSDETGYGEMFLSELTIGGSCHAVGEALNFKLEPLETGLKQGCHFTTLDALVADGVVPMPNHIKIDVDGFEHKVIAGARQALEDERMRSLLVELNTNLPEHQALITTLTDLGFTPDETQIAEAMNTEGVFEGCGNHVFRRG